MDPGDLIGTRYRLGQPLAAGGMGTVWEARDELLGRPVALKVLHQNLATEHGFRQRFRAEARAAARLSHAGVVAVYDYGEDAGVPFLAMELVAGESLHDVLRRRRSLPPDEVMGIVAQAADAVAEAHAYGLVHRDVKPANLLLAETGSVKVADFGIARAMDATMATLDGSVLGTVAYMSPEQVRGQRVDAASDVYSLGVVAYELLAGTRPFPGRESITVALSHLHDPVPPLPAAVPAAVGDLVMSMLRKDPTGRPTARRVAAQAWHLAADPGSAGPATRPLVLPMAPAPNPGRTVPARRRARRRVGALLGPTIALAGGRRSARRRMAAGVVSSVAVLALAVGLLLAAAAPGARPPGSAAATHSTSTRAGRHPSRSHSPTSPTSTTTSTTSPTDLATTASTASTASTPTPGPATASTAAPGPGAGGPGAGGPGAGGPAPGGPGAGGPGQGGPRAGGPAGPGQSATTPSPAGPGAGGPGAGGPG